MNRRRWPATGPGHGGPASGMPASGAPSRPPFAQGNTLAMSSGYRSPRVYGELAQALAAGMTEDRPDLERFPEAVAAWATAEAQAALLRRHMAEVGPLDDDGQPRQGPLQWLVKLESLAARHRATLGLDPRSEAQLARERAEAATLAVDLDALAQRGREAMARRAGEPQPPDLAAEALARVAAEGERATELAALDWAVRPEATDDERRTP